MVFGRVRLAHHQSRVQRCARRTLREMMPDLNSMLEPVPSPVRIGKIGVVDLLAQTRQAVDKLTLQDDVKQQYGQGCHCD
jgi:hypothetical protein